jgi:hypothetical protein
MAESTVRWFNAASALYKGYSGGEAMTKSKFLVFVILAGFLSGCAWLNPALRIHSVVIGKTTVAEASSLFGKPYLVSHTNWGETFYMWDHDEAAIIGKSGRKTPQKGFLMGTFDKDGILRDLTAYGTTSDTMIDYWNTPRKQP